MKPESYAWHSLYDDAAVLLRPGFAERTVRAARVAAPTFASQCLLSAATAAVCLTIGFVVHAKYTATVTERHLAQWQALSVEVQDLRQMQ
jgi:hypothetical protein